MWSNNIRYVETNSVLIPEKGGVYQIFRNDGQDGIFTNVYVGKADDLRRRYLEHISTNEKNILLFQNIIRNECYFRYIFVNEEAERQDVENRLLASYHYECNSIGQ